MNNKLHNLNNEIDQYISTRPVFSDKDKQNIREKIHKLEHKQQKSFQTLLPKTLSVFAVAALFAFIGGYIGIQVGLYDLGGNQNGSLQKPETSENNEKLIAEKPPETAILTFDFEGNKVTEEGTYWEGQNGYYLYVAERVRSEQEGPGVDLFSTNEVPVSTMRIEVLDEMINIEEQKQQIKEQLLAEFPNQEPIELRAEEIKFFKNALFQIDSRGENATTKVFIMQIDETSYKITTTIYESEVFIYSVFDEMVNTIGKVNYYSE